MSQRMGRWHHRWWLRMLLCLCAGIANAADRQPAAPDASSPIVLGVDVLLQDPALLRGKRVGLVTNAGVDARLRSDIDRFAARRDFNLVALFGPEHGVRGDARVQLHVTDAARFQPVRTGLALIRALQVLYPLDFQFLPGDRPFFDKLIGNAWVGEAIARGDSLDALQARWQPALHRFQALRARYLLY